MVRWMPRRMTTTRWKRDRNDDAFQHQRDRRRYVKVRRILDVRLPGDGGREHHRVQGKDVEQREHAVLVEQHEAHQHHAAGEQMGDIERRSVHQKLRDTNRSSMPRKPSIRAMPRKSGTRNTRILAIEVSNRTSRNPPTASLPR